MTRPKSWPSLPGAAYRRLRGFYIAEFHKTLTRLTQDRKDEETMNQHSSWAGTETRTPAEMERRGREAAAKSLQFSVEKARDAAGRGIFEAFLDYQLKEFDALVDNTMNSAHRADADAAGAPGVRGRRIWMRAMSWDFRGIVFAESGAVLAVGHNRGMPWRI